MVVTLRLKRFGRLNLPTFRVCAADPRSPRDGRIIETLGYYLPKAKRLDDQVKLNTERVSYWLSVGAQPSETVRSLIRRAGVQLPQRKRRRGERKRNAKPFAPPRARKPRAKAKPKAKPAGDEKGAS